MLFHLAIAVLAIVIVTTAAVALGLSGSNPFGARVEQTEPVGLAIVDGTGDEVHAASASAE